MAEDSPTLRAWPTALASSYLLGSATVYLLGYWGVFGINIFEFAGLTEVLVLAIRPLAYYALGLAVTSLALYVFVLPSITPGSAENTMIGRTIVKYERAFIGLIVIAAMLIGLLEDRPSRWLHVGMVLSVPIGIFANRTSFLRPFIPDRALRVTAIVLLVELPLFSFGYGVIEGDRVKQSTTHRQVILAGEQFTYVGHTGAVTFLWRKERQELILISDDSYDQLLFLPASDGKASKGAGARPADAGRSDARRPHAH